MGRNLYQYSAFFIAVLFFLFVTTAIKIWNIEYLWHNQQRIAQLLLIAASLFFSVFLYNSFIPRKALLLLLVIFSLGLASSYFSTWPAWALKEWARYVGLSSLVLMVAALAGQNARTYFFVFGVMVSVGAVLTFFYLLLYGYNIYIGSSELNPNRLFTGFSQLRFFAQFQVVLFPVLSCVFITLYKKEKLILSVLVFTIFIIHWAIAFSLAGRGLWLGLLIAAISIVLVNAHAWRLVRVQLCAGVLGFVLYGILFHVIPSVLEIDVRLYDNLRTTLSGRERLWTWAWQMALENPWLGAGPMHFATVYSPLGAHPHQVTLQWLAEWGFAATSLAIVLAAWGVISGIKAVRQSGVECELDACLWMAIVGALVLAQVDGVFVMPYIETWLAILIGLSFARWSKEQTISVSSRLLVVLLALPALVIVTLVLIHEVPEVPYLEQSFPNDQRPGWNPRFWQKGWIPMREH